MIGWNLCHYSDVYIFVNGTIAILGERADDAAKLTEERNEEVIFKKLCTIYWMHKWIKRSRCYDAKCKI